MNALVIISFVFVTLYVIGIFRGIRRKKNRWHAYGFFDQIWGWVDGDKNSILPDSLPWPSGKVYFTLTRTEYVEKGEKLTAYDAESKDGQKIEYSAAETIDGIKKPIRTVVERVTRLRKTEVHPYVIKCVLPKTGFTFFLCFTLKIKVKEPMKILKLDEFLSFVGNELNDAIYPWAVEEEKSLIPAGADPLDHVYTVIDYFIGLAVDDESKIKIKLKGKDRTLKSYMNRKINPYGLATDEFSLDVGFDQKVRNLLDKRNQQTQEVEERNLQIKKNLTRDEERKREFSDEKQIIELDKQRVNDVIEPTLEAIGEMQEKANKAWKAGVTLFIGEDTGSQKQVAALTAGIFNNTKKPGGKNAQQNQSQP